MCVVGGGGVGGGGLCLLRSLFLCMYLREQLVLICVIYVCVYNMGQYVFCVCVCVHVCVCVCVHTCVCLCTQRKRGAEGGAVGGGAGGLHFA